MRDDSPSIQRRFLGRLFLKELITGKLVHMLGEAKEMVKEPAVLNGMLGERSNAEVAKAGGGDDCCHSE